MSAKAILSASVSAAPAVYVEDVFSTFLYTGTGAAQTITNGIDLSGKGGLTWIKGRSGATGHRFTDTTRGATKSLESNSTAAEATESTGLTSFSSTGFVIGADADYNTSAATYCSWTFREAPKFFDVVTWTGDGTAGRTIAHNLGSVPGSIIVKRTDTTADWAVYHRSLANTQYLVLNTTAAAATGATWWNSTTPTSSVFSVGTDASVNASGGTYVAYVFAHDAGGFGTAGTDNVVSCGTFTTDGSGNFTDQNIGYEPQWLMFKSATSLDPWFILDSMRGLSFAKFAQLFANTNGAENTGTSAYVYPTSTGFGGSNGNLDASATYVYIAIRRGPMKTPTVGTEVFAMDTLGGTLPNPPGFNSGFPVDMGWFVDRSSPGVIACTRLQGSKDLYTYLTNAEGASAREFDYNNGWLNNTAVASSYLSWMFRRAPGFFDVVTYTATQSSLTGTAYHNLGVVPELIIIKARDSVNGWKVYSSTLGVNQYLQLHSNIAAATDTGWATVGSTSFFLLAANGPYVAYLFATVAGVSKVGSYTGNGTTQTINCGFTGGARFVLIKRTDSTGDWYVYDTARGMTVLTDPYLLLNSTAAEVATLGSVTTVSTGFALNSTILAAINISAGTYIFLAIS